MVDTVSLLEQHQQNKTTFKTVDHKDKLIGLVGTKSKQLLK